MAMKKFYPLLLLLVCFSSFSQQGPSDILTGRLVRISPKLTDIKYEVPIDTKKQSIKSPKYQELRDKINKRVRFPVENLNAVSSDEALQKSVKTVNQGPSTSVLTSSFDGNGTTDNSAVGFGLLAPPDPVLCVGPNHVVQMINLVHKVFNKSGTLLSGPLKFSTIASTSTDDGDPITLYDHIADRYILMQFSSLFTSGSESLIFCVSQTNDPTGSYYVYEFLTPGKFPDYPHVGIWNNSYVVTTHNFNVQGTAYLGQGFWAFDRNKMVSGEPTVTGIAFNTTGTTDGGYLPASFEGFKTPDPTSQPTFITFDADEFGGSDRLLIRTLTPNFVNPASSVLSSATSLPVAAFDARSPSASPIEQQGTAVRLDAIADRMMSRIIYRRFDNYESLVMNYAVNVSGVSPTSATTYQAATRWYELTRATPASAWTVNQQSTFSPTAISGTTGINRWMGCAGIDQRGNMALAYSRSSTTNFPDIYYAERKKTDPVSTLGSEQVFHASGGSQTHSSGRWGDYSAMTTDPSDEETQWFTAEYYAATASVNFKTRIGSFKINDPLTTPTVHFQKGGTIARQKESITLLPPSTFYKDYPITLVIDQAPSQPVNLTLSRTGTATEGVDYDLLNITSLVLNGSNLTQTFTLRVYDDMIGEVDEYIDLEYTLNANAGNGIAGAYNQKHRITIIGNIVCPSTNVAVTRPTTFCEGDSTIFNANSDPNYTFQWYKNNVLIGGATQTQYIAKTAGSYRVEITRLGCTLSSNSITVIINVGTPVPTTVSRSITFGTVITPGNGLQASSACPGVQTVNYSGPTIGYDNNTKSGADPQVTVSGVGTNLGKTKVSVTWRKRSGGTINDCGTTGGSGQPFYDEVSFRIQAPNGTIINLLNANTYSIGSTPLGVLTTVFEDGGAAVGSLPANGTFNPAQVLSALNGTDPNGIWKLLANDDAASDPLCVESFSVNVLTPSSGGASSITWYNSATATVSVGSGAEYIPTDTAPGTYTYFAEANCSGITVCATSVRKPATLTITCPVVTAPTGTSNPTICSNTSASLSASCAAGTVTWYNASSVAIPFTGSPFVTPNLTSNTTYNVRCENGGCLSPFTVVTVTVGGTLAAPTGTSNPTICSNTSASLSANCVSGNVTWYNASSVAIPFTGSPFVTPNLTSNTTYNVRCENGGCLSPFTVVTVTVGGTLAAPTGTSNPTICSNTSTSLSATCASGSVTWYNASSVAIPFTGSPFVTPNLTSNTTYNVRCENGGCLSPFTVVTVTVGALAAPTGTSNPAICSNTSTSLSATCASGNVTWYNASSVAIPFTGSPFVTPNLISNTTYNVRCENGGCLSPFAVVTVIVNPIPIVDAGANQTICAGVMATLSATCNLQSVNATLSGSSEVPANGSTASGSVIGTFNTTTNQLNLTISFNGLSVNASAGHIHNGASGVNGSVVVPFGGVPASTSGTFTYSGVFSGADATALLAGNTYVNIHNTIFPGGEIRGQLSATCIANNYVWNPGNQNGQTVSVSPVITTTYTLTASNTTTGCSATATTSVIVNTVNATASNTGPYLTGQTIQLNATGGSSYSWVGPNSFTSTTNPANILNATLAMAGIYTVTVTQGSCSATATTSVIVSDNNPCLTVVEYDYVQAGNPFVFKFPLVNNMVIAEVPEETSILVNPICSTVTIESFRMRIQGLPYLHEVVESISPFALFNNTGVSVLGRHLSPGAYSLTITGYEQDNALGNITYGPIITNFTIVSNSASISAPSFVVNSLCAGSTFNVNFTTTGAFNPANLFEVQLSDANGTFNNPTVIGSSPSAGVVACTIPINIGLGSSYKIRVVSTNQIVAGTANGSNLVATTASLTLVSPTNDISGGTSTQQATQIITATNKVLSPANTIYKAGNAILLNAGFQANASSVFKAEIGGCN